MVPAENLIFSNRAATTLQLCCNYAALRFHTRSCCICIATAPHLRNNCAATMPQLRCNYAATMLQLCRAVLPYPLVLQLHSNRINLHNNCAPTMLHLCFFYAATMLHQCCDRASMPQPQGFARSRVDAHLRTVPYGRTEGGRLFSGRPGFCGGP